MILSDEAIKKAVAAGEIGIEPFFESAQLGPASYDLELHPRLLVEPGVRDDRPLDLRDVRGTEYLTEHVMGEGGSYTMRPGEFLLASTYEYVTVGPAHAARVEGRSSLARVGLAVHVTGGFIDPGFSGQITLEMVNLLHRPLTLYPGMGIAQIAFETLTAPAERPYGGRGHYQHQRGATASRYHLSGGPGAMRWYGPCLCRSWAGTYEDWRQEVGQEVWCAAHMKYHMHCPAEECCLEY